MSNKCWTNVKRTSNECRTNVEWTLNKNQTNVKWTDVKQMVVNRTNVIHQHNVANLQQHNIHHTTSHGTTICNKCHDAKCPRTLQQWRVKAKKISSSSYLALHLVPTTSRIFKAPLVSLHEREKEKELWNLICSKIRNSPIWFRSSQLL
jgi:hypothetical protein